MMEYKGYAGRIVTVDETAGIIHGEVAGISDVVTFQGSSPKELAAAFRDSVDDYLAFCSERNEAPEQPFSGRVVLELTPQLHHQAAAIADATGQNLNAWIAELVKTSVTAAKPPAAKRRKTPNRPSGSASRK